MGPDPWLVHQGRLEAVGYPELDVSAYRCENGMELVVCQVESPLFAVYVTVPVRTTRAALKRLGVAY